MGRAFFERGSWRLTEVEGCDAVVQRKATLRGSALAGLLTVALIAGPDLRLADREPDRPRTPAISEPEIVSSKPVDRVPVAPETDALPAPPPRPSPGVAEAAPALAVAGPARIEVIDALTLRAGDMTVRIAGIAPPAPQSACRRVDGLEVRCVDRAASYLELLTRGRAVVCDRTGAAAGGVETGRCRVGETDIAEQMVRQGWAKAADGDERRLTIAEAQAKRQKLGIWRE